MPRWLKKIILCHLIYFLRPQIWPFVKENIYSDLKNTKITTLKKASLLYRSTWRPVHYKNNSNNLEQNRYYFTGSPRDVFLNDELLIMFLFWYLTNTTYYVAEELKICRLAQNQSEATVKFKEKKIDAEPHPLLTAATALNQAVDDKLVRKIFWMHAYTD